MRHGSLRVGSGLLVLIAAFAGAQFNTETLSGETPVKLGNPAVTKASAIAVARQTLAAFGVKDAGKEAKCSLVPRLIIFHAIGSTWVVTFGKRYEVRVSAQSGRLLRFADVPTLEFLSQAQMGQRYRIFKHPVKPELSSAPAICLSAPRANLTIGGRPTTGFASYATYEEHPNGRNLIQTQDTVVFEFDPRNGKPVLFSRALDFTYRDPRQTVSVTSAETAASQISPSKLKVAHRKLEQSSSTLAYRLAPHKKYEQSTYVPELDAATLVWSIRKANKEILIDAGTGKFVEGWTFGSK